MSKNNKTTRGSSSTILDLVADIGPDEKIEVKRMNDSFYSSLKPKSKQNKKVTT
jgi:hypothetical protein